jgi:hypothetical protein
VPAIGGLDLGPLTQEIAECDHFADAELRPGARLTTAIRSPIVEMASSTLSRFILDGP